ncbi:MAG TPA: hypothetical protein VGG39_15675 [Polyangiaceae bacterium]|jgi:hypothetical protein
MLPKRSPTEPDDDVEPVTRTRLRSTYARELARWLARGGACANAAAAAAHGQASPRTGTDDAWAEEPASARIPFLIF